jgi:hypothetical protein
VSTIVLGLSLGLLGEGDLDSGFVVVGGCIDSMVHETVVKAGEGGGGGEGIVIETC